MIDLYNSKLIDILPPNLQDNEDIKAACEANDKSFEDMVLTIKNVLTIADIDNASSEVIDLLAWQFHTDFYDNSLPIDNRRKIVKNSLIYHYTKGTPFAVEQLVTDAFDEAKVEEWFEYGGDPYYFRISISNPLVDPEKVEKLIKAIDSVKNARSHLEKITIDRPTDFNIYCGILVSGSDTQVIDTDIPGGV